MRLLSISLKTGVLASVAGVFGSAFLWLLSFKIMASWMGPEGVGLFSQLRQMAQAATLGATFGGTNSVVQGLAERDEEAARQQFRAMAVRLIGATGAVVTLAMIALAPWLTQFFLSSDAPDLVATVRWIAVAVLLNVGGTYILAVLNGYRSYSYLAAAQIAGPAALVMLLASASWWHVSSNPRLLAESFVLCFGVTYLVGLFGISRLPKAGPTPPAGTLPKAQSRAFIRFALSNLVAALSTTAALLLIRSWLIEAEGLAFAGLFDAGWTLTFNYTTLFLTACNVIYLPLLTAAVRPESQKACVLKTAYLVFGVGIVICHTMVFFRSPLLNLLYSPQFQASGNVLLVLGIAIVFRSTAWVYGTMIHATRNSRVLLVSDLTFNLLLLVTARYTLSNFASLEALGWAFVLSNFLYFVFMLEYVRLKNRLIRRRQIWPAVAAGTLPLFYLALMPSGTQGIHPGAAQWLCLAVGYLVGGAALIAHKRVVL